MKLLFQNQAAVFRVIEKVSDCNVLLSKKGFENRGRAISFSYQNYFGRKRKSKTKLFEIFIFGNNMKTVFFSKAPNLSIRSRRK